MSANGQAEYSDEFEDSEEEDFKSKSQTLRSKGRSQKMTNLRPTSTGPLKKKTSKRPGTQTRPTSAPTKAARELWQNALKSTGGTTGSTKKTKRPAVEYWNESLRRTGTGFSTESTHMSMTGLGRKQGKDMAYTSTSHYLRQLVGAEKPKRSMGEVQSRAPGTPAYKSPEEYYDEIIDLKKQITTLNHENSTMRSKVRRLEEDNLKKEREIEQLLDPGKSEDLRRTLTDRKPDGGAVIHSLKQRILKLEHQLKDKEASHAKLQSDLKTTKMEEMKLQVDTFYKEIVRLNQLKSVDTPVSKRNEMPVKENNVKMKALHETILRMNEKNLRLTSENKTLKQDLEKMLEQSAKAKDTQKEYEDMSKKQLLGAIGKLERRLDKTDADSMSLMSEVENRHSDVQGKITLEGTVAQRLDQLDRRETELLEDTVKQRGIIKRLKEDRAHYRKKSDEKEKEIKSFKKDIDDLQAELDSLYQKDRNQVTPRPVAPRRRSNASTTAAVVTTTPRRGGRASPHSRSRSPSVSSDAGSKRGERERQRRIEHFTQNTAAKHIQRNWRSHQKQKYEDDEALQNAQAAKVDELQELHAARAIQRGWRGHKVKKVKQEEEEQLWRQERDKNVQDFIQNRAAKRIQSGWIAHQGKRHDDEQEEAAELLQSVMRGHMSRKHVLETNKRRPSHQGASVYDEDTNSVSESDLDSAAELVQSSFRGHRARREQLKKSRLEDSDPEMEDAVSTIQSAFRGHMARKGQMSKVNYRSSSKSPVSSQRGASHGRYSPKRLDSAGEEEDDDHFSTISRSSRRSGRASPKVNALRSAARKPPVSPRKLSQPASEEDSDDDVIVTSSRGNAGRFF